MIRKKTNPFAPKQTTSQRMTAKFKKIPTDYSKPAELLRNDVECLEFTIPLFTLTLKNKRVKLAPSLNTLISESIYSRRDRKNHLQLIFNDLGIKPMFDFSNKKGYKVSSTRYCIKLLDPLENLGGQFKNLMDMLVENGIIPDDSAKYIKDVEVPNQIKVSTKAEELLYFKLSQI